MTTDLSATGAGGRQVPVVWASERLAPGLMVSLAAGSWQGRARRQNEDQYVIAAIDSPVRVVCSGVASLARPRSLAGLLMAVADGMGGEGSGDVASALAIKGLVRHVRHELVGPLVWGSPRVDDGGSLPRISEGLRAAFERSHARILRRARHGRASATMGTTLTAALVTWPQMYVAHAGDSRCYLVRRGRACPLTSDHTVAAQMVASGFPLPDERSALHHVLWNALGGGSRTKPLADVRRFALEPGDDLVLCSDGLSNCLDTEEIGATVTEAPDAPSAVHRLWAEARRAGGGDDITVVFARFSASPVT